MTAIDDLLALETNMDEMYGDDAFNPSKKLHQQHHDTIVGALQEHIADTVAHSGGGGSPATIVEIASGVAAVGDALAGGLYFRDAAALTYALLHADTAPIGGPLTVDLTDNSGDLYASLTITAGNTDSGTPAISPPVLIPAGTRVRVAVTSIGATPAEGVQLYLETTPNTTGAVPAEQSSSNVTYVQSAKYASGSPSGTAVLTLPAPPTAGNGLIAFVGFSSNYRDMLAETGWTKLTANNTPTSPFNGLVAYYKTSNGTETSVTFDCENAFDYVGGVLIEVAGQDTGAFLQYPAALVETTSVTAMPTPAFTPTVAGGLALAVVTLDANRTTTLPAGWTLDQSGSVGGHGVHVGHANTPTTIGVPVSTTFTASSSTTYTGWTVVVKPA